MTSNAKGLCYFLGWPAVSQDCQGLFVSKECPSVLFSAKLTTFLHLIRHIVLRRSKKQMVWIIAMTIVAAVTYECAPWNRASVKRVGSAMDHLGPAVNFCFWIPMGTIATPNPAFVVRSSIGSPELEFGCATPAVATDKSSWLSDDPPEFRFIPFGDLRFPIAPAVTVSEFNIFHGEHHDTYFGAIGQYQLETI